MKAKTRCCLCVAVLVALLAPAATPTLAQSKRYRIDLIQIDAQVQADGDVVLTENRTYSFRGAYSWADYRLPLDRMGAVQDFTVSDNGQPYAVSQNEEPGTFYTQTDDAEFYARWFFSARNETRTFTLRYRVRDVVTVYRDTAEFYYKFVGEANRQEIGTVSVSVLLPQAAEFPQVRAWAHGPLHGTVSTEDGRVSLVVAPLPARRFWEGRMTFPPDWVNSAARRIDTPRLQGILEEEQRWAAEANRQREKQVERERMALPITLALSAVGLGFLAFFYVRFGTPFEVPYAMTVDSEIPSDIHPTLVSYLYHHKQVQGAALAATLFNLARQGFLSVEQTGEKLKWWQGGGPRFEIRLNRKTWSAGRDRLTDFDNDLLEFFFGELSRGTDTVDSETLRKGGSRMRRWFTRWKKLVSVHVTEPLYEAGSFRATIYSVIVSVLVTVGGIVTAVGFGKIGFLAMAVGICCIGGSFGILRYTPETKLRRRKWEALKRYLKRYHFAEDTSGSWMPQVGHYLVFALALGAGKKAIERMFERIPADERSQYFPWYAYAHGADPAPSDFAGTFSSVVAATSATVSSGAGAGGGASAGGGGGSGGASGGAG